MEKEADIYLVDEIGEKMFYSDDIQMGYNKRMLEEDKLFIGTTLPVVKRNLKGYELTNQAKKIWSTKFFNLNYSIQDALNVG